MRNRLYGGVRGRKTKVGRKLLRFPPTRFLLLADADSEGNTRMEGVLNIQQNADNTGVWYLLPFKDYRAVVLATFYSDGESIFKDVTDNYKKTYPHIKKVELQAICAIEELKPDK